MRGPAARGDVHEVVLRGMVANGIEEAIEALMGIPRGNEGQFRNPRRWSNQVLRGVAPSFTGHVINVSGHMDEDKEGGLYREYFCGASSYTISNFTGHRAGTSETTDISLDLTQPLDQDLVRKFDVVFSHTTLEHIFPIFTAFENLCSLSRDIVIVVVPFAQVEHGQEQMGDFWRLSLHTLRRLFDLNGLDVIFEAANAKRNTSTYVISIGSRLPAAWQERFSSDVKHPLSESLGQTSTRLLVEKLRLRFMA